MRLRRTARHAEQCAPRIHIPVRCAKPCKRRHKHRAACVLHGLRKKVRFLRVRDKLQLIAQPFDGRARVKRTALKRIGRLTIHAPTDRRNKPPVGENRLITRVHQHKAARAVCIFRHALIKAALSEQRGVLVARNARNRNFPAEYRFGAHAHNAGGVHDFRQRVTRDTEHVQHFLVPIKLLNVKQHGARSVRHVRHIAFALRERINEPRINGTEAQAMLLREHFGLRHVIQNPLHFGAGKIRVDDESRRFMNVLLKSLGY